MNHSTIDTMSDELHPTLVGPRLTIRPGNGADAHSLHDILLEPSVRRWWREPAPPDEIEGQLRGSAEEILLVIEVAGEVAGGIQYYEEPEPDYRHAAIDIFLGTRWQGRGLELRRSGCWLGISSANANIIASPSTPPSTMSGPLRRMPGSASNPSASCVNTSSSPMVAGMMGFSWISCARSYLRHSSTRTPEMAGRRVWRQMFLIERQTCGPPWYAGATWSLDLRVQFLHRMHFVRQHHHAV